MLIHFHGGAFRSGRKSREAQPVLQRLASRGWVCVSANYRLTPQATFPDQLIDASGSSGGSAPTRASSASTFSALRGRQLRRRTAATCALTPNQRDLQPGFEQPTPP